tara:strand:- start:1109 stop:1447 length:339 start_codon:yes stop_codon:yes gene_type:complete
MEIPTETWMHQIREIGPRIQTAEFNVWKKEADLKKLLAKKKLEATAAGCRSVASQEIWAENDESVYLARLKLGTARGALSGVKVELEALKVGFEEWRTKMVNTREERKRYGA